MYIHLNVRKQMTDFKLLQLHSNTWNHLTVFKKWAEQNVFTNHICLIWMKNMNKQDLALNGWYTIKPNQTKLEKIQNNKKQDCLPGMSGLTASSKKKTYQNRISGIRTSGGVMVNELRL